MSTCFLLSRNFVIIISRTRFFLSAVLSVMVINVCIRKKLCITQNTAAHPGIFHVRLQ